MALCQPEDLREESAQQPGAAAAPQLKGLVLCWGPWQLVGLQTKGVLCF